MDKVYAIFNGSYSDWNVHRFLEDKDEARKYCAIKNENNYSDYGSYYVVEIDKLNVKIKDVKLKYYHTVVFDFGEGMRQEPNRYEYYIGEDKLTKIIYNENNKWISFSLNAESREKAEKIAQDKYSQLLYYFSENKSFSKSAELLNAIKYKTN